MEILDRRIQERVVQTCVRISADQSTCWRFLTEPDLRAQWFADSELPENGTFDLNFGDGDFFRVKTILMEEPARLSWVWQFMGVGSRSDIDFRLMTSQGGTEVAVSDRGQYSESGAHELEEGWSDFLSRLRRRIETGENSRYQWSETIGASIVVRADAETVSRVLHDRELWKKFFPGAEIGINPAGDRVDLEFHRKEWGNTPTKARLSLAEGATGLNLSILHEGWLDLPGTCRIEERRRAARSWTQALSELELRLAR